VFHQTETTNLLKAFPALAL